MIKKKQVIKHIIDLVVSNIILSSLAPMLYTTIMQSIRELFDNPSDFDNNRREIMQQIIAEQNY